jgi:hypothetical protein
MGKARRKLRTQRKGLRRRVLSDEELRTLSVNVIKMVSVLSYCSVQIAQESLHSSLSWSNGWSCRYTTYVHTTIRATSALSGDIIRVHQRGNYRRPYERPQSLSSILSRAVPTTGSGQVAVGVGNPKNHFSNALCMSGLPRRGTML